MPRVDRAGGSAVPGWALAPVAGVGGLLASTAYAPFDLWPAAFLGVAALAWCVSRSRRLGTSVLLALAFGLVHMATSLIWQTSIMVLSYAGLTLVTTLPYAVIGACLHLTRTLRAAPLWGAGAWSLGEALIAHVPFDGFGWMRLGYTQLGSWLAGLYPLVGAVGVTFVVALLGHLLADVARPPRPRRLLALLAALGVTAAVGVPLAAWTPGATAGHADIGWVQGGAPGGGVYGLGPARTITRNSHDETVRLAQRVRAGELPPPSFVAWPENSTDMDPRTDAPTSALVEGAVRAAGVPILVGSIFEDAARDERQTVAVWWDADGPETVYAKRNLVPFGEWIPLRDFFLPLVPQLAYVGAQSIPGTSPGAFDVTTPDGRTLGVGLAICYEVIYPGTLYEAAAPGPRAMIVQSSNAMYQGTIQIAQQFAITRVRAAEMRREILVVTTSGISGHIGTRGEVLRTVPSSVAASGVEQIALADHATPIMTLGPGIEIATVALGAIGALLGLANRVRSGRGGTMDVTASAGGTTKE